MTATVWMGCLLSALVLGWNSPAQTRPTGRGVNLVSVAQLTPRQVKEGSAQLTGAYDPQRKIRVTFALRSPHPAEEQEFLEELHTKGSPQFMRFLSQQEWIARFAPSAQDEQAVVDWAHSKGLTITQRYPNRLRVDTEGTVATIQTALGVRINTYAVNGSAYFSNDRDPVLPSNLANVLQSVGGLNNFQSFRPANHTMSEPAFAEYTEGPEVMSDSGAVGGEALTSIRIWLGISS